MDKFKIKYQVKGGDNQDKHVHNGRTKVNDRINTVIYGQIRITSSLPLSFC